MPDMENVIKGLHDIGGFIAGRIGIAQARNFLRTIDDTIDLLKEQEDLGTELTNAVELIHKKNERIEKLLKEQEAVVHPEPSCEMTYITDCCCDLCGVQLIREDNFCRCCGKRIEWEGR